MAFGILRGQHWTAGILAGLAYAAVLRFRGRIGDAVAAHAVSNLLPAAWVLLRGDWAEWQAGSSAWILCFALPLARRLPSQPSHFVVPRPARQSAFENNSPQALATLSPYRFTALRYRRRSEAARLRPGCGWWRTRPRKEVQPGSRNFVIFKVFSIVPDAPGLLRRAFS